MRLYCELCDLVDFRAWVPVNQVFMLSAEPPSPIAKKKGSGFDEAMAELEKYIFKFK